MNGETLPEDFWSRLDERFEKIHGKLDKVSDKVNTMNAEGCAQGKIHTEDLKSLFSWRDKAIVGFIVLLLSAIGSLGTAFFALATRK